MVLEISTELLNIEQHQYIYYHQWFGKIQKLYKEIQIHYIQSEIK